MLVTKKAPGFSAEAVMPNGSFKQGGRFYRAWPLPTVSKGIFIASHNWIKPSHHGQGTSLPDIP